MQYAGCRYTYMGDDDMNIYFWLILTCTVNSHLKTVLLSLCIMKVTLHYIKECEIAEAHDV